MDIPYQALEASTLENVIIDFVTREGTDYGHKEIPIATKVEKVKKMLANGAIKIVYNPDEEYLTLIEVN